MSCDQMGDACMFTCTTCVDYGFCLIIQLHIEDHKLITTIRITHKLSVNRANAVRDFKSEFIFI